MGTLRKLAHLREQLGEKRFEDLINPENTGKVKRFCDKLFRDSLPQEMTVGDRTYEILGFHEEGEGSVDGQTVVRRVSEIDANPNKEAGEHLLKHQHQIPVELRGNTFVFTRLRQSWGHLHHTLEWQTLDETMAMDWLPVPQYQPNPASQAGRGCSPDRDDRW